MPEYYGYIAPPTPKVDFTEILGEVGAKIVDAFNVRDNERAAFAERTAQSEASINQYESSQNPTLEGIVQDGANSARETFYEWQQMANRGEMTQAEFKKRMNNTDQYWTAFASAAKSFDERTLETLKRQQSVDGKAPDGSGFELYINKTHSEIANLSGRSVYINPESGRMYLAKRDADGNILDYVDVRQMNNPGNIIDNRIHLNKTIAENVKNWGEWKDYIAGARGSSQSIEDIRRNPEFTAAKNSLIRSVVSNDRAAASVLVDNGAGDYDFYASEGELMGKLQRKIENARRDAMDAGQEFDEQAFAAEASKRMILARRDETGVFQPILTQEQRDAAYQRVGSEIEIQLGMTETGTPERAPSGGGGSGGGGDDGGDAALYEQLFNAWTNPKSAPAMLTSASGGKYRFEWGPGGMRVLSSTQVNKGGKPIYPEIASGIKTLRDLAPYFFGYGTGAKGTRDSFAEFDKQEEIYKTQQNPNWLERANPGGVSSSGGVISKFGELMKSSGGNDQISEDEWIERWNKLKPGQSMVGLDGKTYTKQ